METSLHRSLKALYAGGTAETEVALGDYRIDVVRRGVLIEIQHGSLSAIRDKVGRLLVDHRVRIVKPIVMTKLLVKRIHCGGPVVERRKSPLRGSPLDLFDELIYLRRVFPHERLTIDLVPVDVEEWRYPGHGRRRRRRERDHVVEDQLLLATGPIRTIRAAVDLWRLIEAPLPSPFHTGDLAAALCIPRYRAQRIAYCLRHAGAVREVGKAGNARMYLRAGTTKRRAA